MKTVAICLFSAVLCATHALALDTITFYRDGAIVQQRAVATKGLIEIPLAADLMENSLTVTPDSGTTIIAVETVKSSAGSAAEKELAVLTEQRQRLDDRLLALETREAIFTAAAKAQSGKAPRKSKANPDPLQNIRQGTDFAIVQLEAVYTARRKTRQEIAVIDGRLAAAAKKARPPLHSMAIAVVQPRGSVTIRYATAGNGWLPTYKIHLSGKSSAQLELSATPPPSIKGYQTRVSAGSLFESAAAETFAARTGSTPLASHQLALTEEHLSGGLFNRFSATITNSSAAYLPPGEATLFRNGAYLGKLRFEGLSSGRSGVIAMVTPKK